MVFTVFLLSCCTLCYFLCQKVNSLMLCFTFPMPQVNTLTLLSFDTLTVLCLSRQANAVCFACATWLLLLSPCKRSCCCMQLVVIKTFLLFACLSLFLFIRANLQSKQITAIVCSCLFLLSSLVAVFGVYYVYFSFSFGFFLCFSLFLDAQTPRKWKEWYTKMSWICFPPKD